MNRYPNTFGPYGYRGNAAQYFNLLWPLCLGFWWCLRTGYYRSRKAQARSGGGPHVFAALLAVTTIMAPTLSASRGGAVISVLGLAGALLGLYRAKSGAKAKAVAWIILAAVVIVGASLFIARDAVTARFASMKSVTDAASAEDRLNQYERTFDLIRDYPVLGVGPICYCVVYTLYLRPTDTWYPYAHSDWFQLVAEWGFVGAAIVLAALLVALALAFTADTANHVLLNTLVIGLLATLLYATFDFPFQIHSIVFLFLLVLAILTSLPREQRTVSKSASSDRHPPPPSGR